MIDAERVELIASTLAADGYRLAVAEAADRVRVTITATAEACADCLVPKDMMRGILGHALGVDSTAIDLTYPSDSEPVPSAPADPSTPEERGSHGPQD